MKVLTLRLYHENPKFFQIPRELRDRIYALALTEPTFYDKRHREGCPHYDRDSACETPPILSHHSNHSSICRSLCVRRKGFGLLRVNKQIHSEAAPIFWSSNTVCFWSRREMIEVLRRVSDCGLSQVCSLAIWDVNHRNNLSEATQQEMYPQLFRLSKLRHLEIHADEVSRDGDIICNLPSLRSLRMWELEEIKFSSDDFHWVNAYAGFYREWEVPRCLRERGNRLTSPVRSDSEANPELSFTQDRRITKVRIWCVACKETANEMARTSRQWIERPRQDIQDPVLRKLERIQPAREDNGPYKTTVTLGTGEKETVCVWGLPLDTPAVRLQRLRKHNKQMLRANRSTTTRRTVLYLPDRGLDEDDVPVFGDRTYNTRRKRVELKFDHDQILEERNERRAEDSKREAASKREQEVANQAARQKGEKEIAAAKKVALKRQQRRAA